MTINIYTVQLYMLFIPRHSKPNQIFSFFLPEHYIIYPCYSPADYNIDDIIYPDDKFNLLIHSDNNINIIILSDDKITVIIRPDVNIG